jgi:hypothetical protein
MCLRHEDSTARVDTGQAESRDRKRTPRGDVRSKSLMDFGWQHVNWFQFGSPAGFLSAVRCDRLEAMAFAGGAHSNPRLRKMKSTGIVGLGRSRRSSCFAAVVATGLVFGCALMSPGRAWAATSHLGADSSQGDQRGPSAVIELPAAIPTAATESAKQADTETLDEGAPPPATSTVTTPGEDVETLDQGSPPTASSAAPVGSVAGTYVAPTSSAAAPSYAAPTGSTSSGPTIPPGFGTGHVHVAAGHPEFPVGLASCHVGTITGRAYVGVDCPNGDSVVGFAPSLNDFPFILEADFPFEGDEGFLIEAARSEAEAADAGRNNVDVLASMPDRQSDSSTSEPQIGVSGASSVQYAQKSRTTQPTVVTDAGQSSSERTKKSKQSSGESSSTRSQNANQGKDGGSGRAYSLAKRQTAHMHQRQRQDRQSANDRTRRGDGHGHAKQAHHQKNKGHDKNSSHGKNKSGGKK